jgi:homoserine O-succinyltransferase/O-acetyltransferase
MQHDQHTDDARPGSADRRVKEAGHLEIALVVNMPDAALEATERQFRTLVEEAAEGSPVRLRLYALPDVPRGEEARARISRSYSDISDLWKRPVDGLIVTGTEPQKPELSEEPYWESLTRLVDWADRNSRSTVWSCLAAHAAVQHLDGIRRRRLDDKRFGVFECARTCEHPLTAGAAQGHRMPHSRWNDLREDELSARGYEILTRSAEAGVDAFVRQQNSLFLFFQGHPEYETVSLMLEYRRDIRRFLRQERESFPACPRGYFDEEALAAIAQLRDRALADPRASLIDEFPTAKFASTLTNTWRPSAVALYRNWLQYISAQKEQTLATT